MRCIEERGQFRQPLASLEMRGGLTARDRPDRTSRRRIQLRQRDCRVVQHRRQLSVTSLVVTYAVNAPCTDTARETDKGDLPRVQPPCELRFLRSVSGHGILASVGDAPCRRSLLDILVVVVLEVVQAGDGCGWHRRGVVDDRRRGRHLTATLFWCVCLCGRGDGYAEGIKKRGPPSQASSRLRKMMRSRSKPSSSRSWRVRRSKPGQQQRGQAV